MICSVNGCSSNPSYNKKGDQELLSFHGFPKNVELRNEWIRRTGKRNWAPRFNRICSKHFDVSAFVCDTPAKYRRLVDNAVPTLFLPVENDDIESVPYQLEKPIEQPQDTESNEDPLHLIEDFKEEPKTEPADTPNLLWEPSQTVSNQNQDVEPIADIKIESSCRPPLYKPRQLGISSPTNSTQNQVFLMQTQMIKTYKQKIHTLENQASLYENKIRALEKEVDRVTRIGSNRLRKNNALQKQLARLTKKNVDLFNILMEKMRGDVQDDCPTVFEEVQHEEDAV